MALDNEVIHEIHHQLAENNGKLVPGDQASAFAGRGDFGDVHGTDGRSQAYAHAAQDAVAVKRYQQALAGNALLEEEEFRIVGAQGAQQEQYTCYKQRFLTAEAMGQPAGNQGADYTADKRAGSGKSMPAIRIDKVPGTLEEVLQTFFGPGNNRRVISEQQPADNGHQHDADQVQRAACLSVRTTLHRGSGGSRKVPACRRQPRVHR